MSNKNVIITSTDNEIIALSRKDICDIISTIAMAVGDSNITNSEYVYNEILRLTNDEDIAEHANAVAINNTMLL